MASHGYKNCEHDILLPRIVDCQDAWGLNRSVKEAERVAYGEGCHWQRRKNDGGKASERRAGAEQQVTLPLKRHSYCC